MARGIYEITLKNNLFPALNAEDALEMQMNGSTNPTSDEEFVVKEIVSEEHTMKMFLLAKAMNDLEKFEYDEVEAAVRAVARELGYYNNAAEVADCILTYVERFDDLTMEELQEWIIA